MCRSNGTTATCSSAASRCGSSSRTRCFTTRSSRARAAIAAALMKCAGSGGRGARVPAHHRRVARERSGAQFEVSFAAPPDGKPDKLKPDHRGCRLRLRAARRRLRQADRSEVGQGGGGAPDARLSAAHPPRFGELVELRDIQHKVLEEKSANFKSANKLTVSVKLDGGSISANINGKTYSFKAPGDRNGFFGFSFHGPGYAAIVKPKLTGKGNERRRSECIGRTIAEGRYEIVKTLGEGGMGAVYRGEHMRIGSAVAIKVLLARGSRDAAGRSQRFQREAQAASRIEHAEHRRRLRLRRARRRPPLHRDGVPRGRAAARALDEATAAAARRARVAHRARRSRARSAPRTRAGIVHRDLKPDNMFLVDRERAPTFVKVLDFGIAKLLRRRRASATLDDARGRGHRHARVHVARAGRGPAPSTRAPTSTRSA